MLKVGFVHDARRRLCVARRRNTMCISWALVKYPQKTEYGLIHLKESLEVQYQTVEWKRASRKEHDVVLSIHSKFVKVA